MIRFAVALGLAVTLLGLTGVVLFLPYEVREAPLPRPLELLATELPGWTGSPDVEPEILPADPRGRSIVRRTYRNSHDIVWLSLDYYGAAGEGHRPPAQAMLYPGHGWSELSARTVQIPLGDPARVISANLVVMKSPARRIAVVYWYQVQRRSIGSDHWYRAVMVYNRLVHGRADSALVRLAMPIDEATAPETIVARQAKFIQAFYPELVGSLAR